MIRLSGPSAGAPDVWRAYDHSVAAVSAAATGTAPDAALFEALCLLEQVFADTAQTARQPFDPGVAGRLRQAAAAAAVGLWGDAAGGTGRCAVDAAGADRLRELRDGLPTASAVRAWLASHLGDGLPGSRFHTEFAPKVPECLSTAPIAYDAYVTAVARWLDGQGAAGRDSGAVAVGIRTSGSYLAPLWVAGHARLGWPCTYRTVRPPSRYTRAGADADAGPAPDELTGLRAARIYLVDDGTATGHTLAAGLAALASAGAHGGRVTPVLYREPARPVASPAGLVVLPGTGHACARRPGRARPEVAAALRDLGRGLTARDTDVRPLPAGYWSRYLTCHAAPGADAPPAVNLRKHRYLVHARDTAGAQVRLIAKYLGHGWCARAEVEVLGLLPASVPVLGLSGGFLFLHYVDGHVAGFRDGPAWSGADITRMARCVGGLRHRALLQLMTPAAVSQRAVDSLAWLRARGVRGLPQPSAVAAPAIAPDGAPVPVVRAPRNHGFWHLLRGDDGRLIRLHRDVGHWERRIDPVEDLASLAVEAGLTEAALDHLVRAYAADVSTVDPAPVSTGRLVAGVLSHARRVLAEFEAREALVPDGGRLRAGCDGFQRRREFLTRHLGDDLAKVRVGAAGW